MHQKRAIVRVIILRDPFLGCVNRKVMCGVAFLKVHSKSFLLKCNAGAVCTDYNLHDFTQHTNSVCEAFPTFA